MFEFDPIAYLKEGAPMAPAVIFVVMAGVYFAGKYGVKGKVQLMLALVFGFLLGGGLLIATTEIPTGFSGWFFVLLYALVMAVTPSLLYDQGKELINKAIAKQLGNDPHGRG